MLVSLRMPTTPGTGQLQIGLGFPPALAHWPQFLIPLALTAICVAWQTSKRPALQRRAIGRNTAE